MGKWTMKPTESQNRLPDVSILHWSGRCDFSRIAWTPCSAALPQCRCRLPNPTDTDICGKNGGSMVSEASQSLEHRPLCIYSFGTKYFTLHNGALCQSSWRPQRIVVWQPHYFLKEAARWRSCRDMTEPWGLYMVNLIPIDTTQW